MSPPIFLPLYEDADDGPIHHATATLLKYAGRHFLCTAAHAFLDQPKGGHALFAGGPAPFSLGEFRLNHPVTGYTLSSDLVDFAAMEMNSEQVSKCAKNSFLDLSLDTPWSPFGSRTSLLACGFPNSENPRRNDDVVTANALLLPLELNVSPLAHDRKRKKYRNAFISGTFDPRFHQMEKRFKGRHNYNGMSGGPLFYESLDMPEYFYELAGILVESKVGLRGDITFKGIRTRSLIQLIHYWFPDTPPVLPPYQGSDRKSTLR